MKNGYTVIYGADRAAEYPCGIPIRRNLDGASLSRRLRGTWDRLGGKGAGCILWGIVHYPQSASYYLCNLAIPQAQRRSKAHSSLLYCSCSSSHMSSVNCDSSGGASTLTGLRIASVFTIWITSTFSAAFPILAHRSRVIRIPRTIFEYFLTARCYLYLSRIGTGSPSISVLVSSLPRRLSTSSPPRLASSPRHVLEPCGKAMCALYPAVLFLVLPILI